MNSSSKYHRLLLLVLLKRHPVRYRQVLALVSSNGSAESVSGHVVQVLGFDFAEVVCQI